MVSVQELQAATLSPVPLVASETSPNRNIRLEAGPYVARVAVTEVEREAAYILRFMVFNLEMNEGLESAYIDGLDKDRYDDVCDHLIIEEKATGSIVGTYRLQMGDAAGKAFGYYSEQEFSFAPFEHMRSQIVELGRACIHRAHRSPEVLHLLWRGIARYALANGGRYMMGCCSLNSQDTQMGHAVYAGLQSCMVEPELRTVAMAAYKLELPTESVQQEKAPKLLRAYLAIGAKICSEPAIDREFKTIDFLTLLDLHTLHPRVAARFLEAN
jgi:putative hemolysin